MCNVMDYATNYYVFRVNRNQWRTAICKQWVTQQIEFAFLHLCLVLSGNLCTIHAWFQTGKPYLSESLLQKLQPLPLMWSVWSRSSSWLQNKMKTLIVAEGCRCCRSLSLRCSQTTNEPAWHFLQRHSRLFENKPGIRVCPSNGSWILN